MKPQIGSLLSVIFLSSCTPFIASAPINTSHPTFPTSPEIDRPDATSTLHPISHTASPLPTQEILKERTPDVEVLDNWMEYESALAVTLLGFALETGPVLCEWELLGRNRLEVYVYAVCIATVPLSEDSRNLSGADVPAVIHLDEDGSIKSVELPGGGTAYARDIRRMFPIDAQHMIFNDQIDSKRLSENLRWRLDHQEVPPLFVLEATPLP